MPRTGENVLQTHKGAETERKRKVKKEKKLGGEKVKNECENEE